MSNKQKRLPRQLLAKAADVLWKLDPARIAPHRSSAPSEYDVLAMGVAHRIHSGWDSKDVAAWLVSELIDNWEISVDAEDVRRALAGLYGINEP